MAEAASRLREGLKVKKPEAVQAKAVKRPKPVESNVIKRPKPVEYMGKDAKSRKASSHGTDKSPMSEFNFKKKHTHNF